MVASTLNRKVGRKSISQNDEFGKYLQKQILKTTCNGAAVAKFAWYKKVLGLI